MPTRKNLESAAWILLCLAVTAIALWALLDLDGNHRASSPSPASSASEARNHAEPQAVLEPALIHGGTKDNVTDPVADAVEPDRDSDVEVRGRVLDVDTRKPVSGALVRLVKRQDTGASIARVDTDSDGRFVLSIPRITDPQIVVICERYQPHSIDLLVPTAPLEILLDPGSKITGRVIDDLGNPVSGARVSASKTAARSLWPSSTVLYGAIRQDMGATCLSESDGTFLLGGLGSNQSYFLRATHSGYALDERNEPPSVLAGTVDVTLQIHRLTRIVVRIVDSRTGKLIPLGSHYVHAPNLETLGPLRTGDPDLDSLDGRIWRSNPLVFDTVAKHDQSGGSSSELSSTKMRIIASPIGYEPIDSEVEVVLGKNRVHDVRAKRLSNGPSAKISLIAELRGGAAYDGMLSLLVANAEKGVAGKPVRLSVKFRNGKSEEPIELPPGKYRVSPIGHGPYTEFWTPAGEQATWSVSSGENSIVIKLAGNPVSIVARDGKGRRIRHFHVMLQSKTRRAIGPFWDVEGLGGDLIGEQPSLWLWPGSSKLKIWSEQFQSEEAQVQLDGSGERVTLHLNLIPSSK